jgi:hypothetical protein
MDDRGRRSGLRLKTEMLSWDDSPEWIGLERKLGSKNA